MEKIILVLIGTTHETPSEEAIFKKLDEYVTKFPDKVRWLCEGESYGRKCVSIKDNNTHLLTDALFVNMMLHDGVYTDDFYDRVAELLITIHGSGYKQYLLDRNIFFYDCVPFDDAGNMKPERLDALKRKPYRVLKHDLKKLCTDIVDLVLSRKIIVVDEECVKKFFNTGKICEDELLTLMREKSFVREIMKYVIQFSGAEFVARPLIFVTVGSYHVAPLSKFFKSRGIDVRNLIIS